MKQQILDSVNVSISGPSSRTPAGRIALGDRVVIGLQQKINKLNGLLNEKDNLVNYLDNKTKEQQKELTTRINEIPSETGINLKEFSDSINKILAQDLKNNEVQIDWQGEERLKITIPGDIAFLSGNFHPSLTCTNIIQKISSVVKEQPNVEKWIFVKGHTDAMPIGDSLKDKFQSNLDLSKSRAEYIKAMIQNLIQIENTHISSQGFSYFQPLSEGITYEERAKNRRIEIIISKDRLLI